MNRESGGRTTLWQMVVLLQLLVAKSLPGGLITAIEYIQYLPRAVVWEEYWVDAVELEGGGAAGDYLEFFSLTWPLDYTGWMISVEVGYDVYSIDYKQTVQPKCPPGEDCQFTGAIWIGTGWNDRSCGYSVWFEGYQQRWSDYCPGGFIDTLLWSPPIRGWVYLDWDSSEAQVLHWGLNAVTTFRFEADVQPWVKWTIWQEMTDPEFLIPEPVSGSLLMLGLAALGLIRRLRAA